MRICGSLLAALFACLLAADVAAQEGVHTDVYVFDDNGTLATAGFGCPDTECGAGTVLNGQRVFSEVLNQFAIEGGPGYRALGGDLPVDTNIDWDFLPLTVDSGPHAGHTSSLLYWDGVGSEAEFGPTPTPDYVMAFLGKDNMFALAGSGDQVVPGQTVFTSTGSGATHTHGTYQLDPDGDIFSLDTPDDGVYAFSMRLRADGLETSDPYFIVFRTENSALAPALPIAVSWVEERVDTLFVDGLPGDADGDGDVDGDDLIAVQSNFGQIGAPPLLGDADADGDVDGDDLIAVQSNFGATQAVAVPEPTGATLVGCFLAAIGARRRSSRVR